jgi:hypothetical protein
MVREVRVIIAELLRIGASRLSVLDVKDSTHNDVGSFTGLSMSWRVVFMAPLRTEVSPIEEKP